MRIAISGLNNTDNPAPGIGVAKSLAKYYDDLVGFSYDPNEPGVYQGIFNKVYLMPFPRLGYEELEKRLEYIKPDVVIPTLDAELPLYIKYQDELAKKGIKTYLPTLEQFEMRDKAKLADLSEELGVIYPETIKMSSIDDLVYASKQFGFPLMVKGNYYKAYKAYSLEEAIEYFYKISNEWGFPLLAQKVVSGVELNFVGVADGEELKGGIAIKKLTTTDIGKVWTAVTIDNKEILEVAKNFVKATKWRGPFELETLSDGKNIYMIEINPRFPAWVYFSTMAGVDLPKMLMDLIEGKEVETNLNFDIGKMYVRYVDELITDFNNFSKILTTKEL